MLPIPGHAETLEASWFLYFSRTHVCCVSTCSALLQSLPSTRPFLSNFTAPPWLTSSLLSPSLPWLPATLPTASLVALVWFQNSSWSDALPVLGQHGNLLPETIQWFLFPVITRIPVPAESPAYIWSGPFWL